MGDQVLEEAKKELQENMSREALLTQAYCPSRKGEPYTTGFIVEDLDEEESLGFLSACRAHGVTPNSAFTVAVHGVTVDLLRAAGRLQEEYHLRGTHHQPAAVHDALEPKGNRYWTDETIMASRGN